ncbi:type III secretion HpaP family protein [Burkholderia diffusa]|uniref:type III secretion HpaP family protein n=1 Tax=Burkholderia diffusa TaxID=488732 RepID=UPI00075CAD4E|nr:type III secretion HpaP family protein [Burkholderia diffusa]KVN02928.1 hypothetical protein WJ62_12005 [Burkholderia diffusa]
MRTMYTAPLVSNVRQASTRDEPHWANRESDEIDGQGDAQEGAGNLAQGEYGRQQNLDAFESLSSETGRDQQISEQALYSLIDGVAVALVEHDTRGVRQCVRLSIKAHILPDTEAIVLRDGSVLTVRLRTRSPQIHRLLLTNADVLRSRLTNGISDCAVQLEIVLETSDERLAYT